MTSYTFQKFSISESDNLSFCGMHVMISASTILHASGWEEEGEEEEEEDTSFAAAADLTI